MISLHKQSLAVGGGESGDRPMGPSSGLLELCRAYGKLVKGFVIVILLPKVNQSLVQRQV
jgi:hypothetical protein